MRINRRPVVYRTMLLVLVVVSSAGAVCTWAQGMPATDEWKEEAPTPPPAAPLDQAAEMHALAESVRALQAQVQALTAEVTELREGRQRTRAQTADRQAADLGPEGSADGSARPELQATRPHETRPHETTADGGTAQLGVANSLTNGLTGVSGDNPAGDLNAGSNTDSGGDYGASEAHPGERGQQELAGSVQNAGPQGSAENTGEAMADRIDKLEEEQQFIDAKINEQYQSKVESGSKYRLRLSGMVLLNLYDNRGAVDNQDFPQTATRPSPGDSAGAFGGTLRQSQIGLDVFGPDIAGAHTSANVKFDFAGGLPSTDNGVVQGLMRLRTGVMRFDWSNTSVVAGQDRLFFAPLTPTSLASVAVPALSYAGDLWSWTPQIRVERRQNISGDSSLLLQAGILDSLSGDIPRSTYNRLPTWGESSGQPAYAARVAWSRHLADQNLTVGFGGYFGRQNWRFMRTVDAWAATIDVAVPVGKWFALTGAFYRGRALGGLAGGIGQDVLMSGPISDPTATIQGLDSAGGWLQLKFKPRAKLEINGAFGDDNPFASELRRFNPAQSGYSVWLSKNLSPFANIIYQLRSNVVIAMEYRRLQTFALGNGSSAANHVNLSLGYMF
jgi:hypothetical protein